MSTHSAPLRTLSPLLENYPWLTSATHHHDLRTLVNSGHCSSRFLSQLYSFETGALLCRSNVDAAYHRHLLQLSYDGSELLVSQSCVRKRTEYLDLVSLLSAYRLADVIAFMEGGGFPLAAPKAVPRTIKPGRLLTKYDKLNDWVNLLLDFRASQKRSKPSKGVKDSRNVHIVLSKWVVHQLHAGRLSAIGTNFFGAAMHLSYLLLHAFSENQLPELCSNFNALSDVQLSKETESAHEFTATEFTADEVRFWKGIFGEDDNKRERLPLQLALLISPVCLFMPIQIFKNRYGKENVVQTSIALGNQRPPVLVSVERALWTVLFDIATGLRHPETALENLATSLPWDDILACSAEDRAWFQLSTSDDQDPSAAKSTNASSPTTGNIPLNIQPLSQPQPSSILYIDSSTAQASLIDDDSSERPDEIAIAASQAKRNLSLTSAGAISKCKPLQQLGEDREKLDAERTSNPQNDAQQFSHITLASVCPSMEAISMSVDAPSQQTAASHLTVCSPFGASISAQTLSAPAASDPMAIDGFEGDLNLDKSHFPLAMDGVDDAMEITEGENGDGGGGPGSVASAEEGEGGTEMKENEELELQIIDVNLEGREQEEVEGQKGSSKGAKEPEVEEPAGVRVDRLRRSASPPKEYTFEAPRPSRSAATAAFTTHSISRDKLPTRRSSRQKPKPATTPFSTFRIANPGSETGNKRKRLDTPTETKPLNAFAKAQRTLSGRRLLIGNETPNITQAGTRDDPIRIDVDAYCLFEAGEDTFQRVDADLQPLCPSWQTQRVTTKLPLNVWDADLKRHPLFPRFHHKQELEKFIRIMDSVSDNYVDGLPRHVVEPSTSLFRTIDYSDYEQLNVDDLNAILRKQCIVVRKMPWAKIGFDRAGLKTLSAVDAVISVQDLSLAPHADGSDRIKNGTLQQMLQSSTSGSRAKALNALSFPFLTADSKKSCFDSNPHATCRVAWINTSGTLFQRQKPMPLSDVHWGLAATAGAMTWWHLDSDGFGTTVDVHTGSKLWIAGSDEEERFSTLGLLLSEQFDIDIPPKAFRTEAVLLTPGTRLIMRPGTVHAVFTPNDCICHGSHFYSTPTMQATLVSLIHGFVCHRYITNISHPLTRAFIRRILHFYHRGLVLKEDIDESAHLPNLDVPPKTHLKIDEVLNLLSVCFMVLCMNVLDPRTYLAPGQGKDASLTAQQRVYLDKYDVNAVSLDERKDVCKSRGACLEVLAWFRKCFVVTVKESNTSVDLPSIFFFQLSRSLLRYKYAAEVNRIQAAGDCQLSCMRRQLDSSLALDKETWSLWSAQDEDFWMDDELRDPTNVEVLDRCADPGSPNLRGDSEVESLCMGLEEGEVDERADRCIDMGREAFPVPKSSTDGPKWRLDSLQLENKDAYSIIRRDVQYQPLKVDDKRWRHAGTNSLDEAFFAGVDFRKAGEAVVACGHIAELEGENQ